ncbi:UNC93 protein MFSD11 [Biomphalaria glabrata]|nr:UNC93 protein MFSD11 [Biomphalaria glabrata]
MARNKLSFSSSKILALSSKILSVHNLSSIGHQPASSRHLGSGRVDPSGALATNQLPPDISVLGEWTLLGHGPPTSFLQASRFWASGSFWGIGIQPASSRHLGSGRVDPSGALATNQLPPGISVLGEWTLLGHGPPTSFLQASQFWASGPFWGIGHQPASSRHLGSWRVDPSGAWATNQLPLGISVLGEWTLLGHGPTTSFLQASRFWASEPLWVIGHQPASSRHLGSGRVDLSGALTTNQLPPGISVLGEWTLLGH